MGYGIGLPSLKLNNAGMKSKSCGDFGDVAREALSERIGRDPDIDSERAALNRYTGYQTAAELQEYSRQHCETLRDAKGRKLRKDAVVMCATILKPPAAYMATLSLDDQCRFLDDAYAAFVDIVGEGNVKARADHFDELGAHSHVFWEPMTEDGRLCAKEVHNLKFFGRVNREMPQRLREKGWEIEDCEMYDAAKEEYEKAQKQSGRSSMAFKAAAEKEKQELEKRIEELNSQIALEERRHEEMLQLNDTNLKIIEENEAVIKDQEEALRLIASFEEYEAESDRINQHMDLLDTASRELPEATRLFKAAEANVWLQRMQQILKDICALIIAGIKRLKIFEAHHGVKDGLSVPLQERVASLEQQIFGADSRKELPSRNGESRNSKRER